MAQSFIDIIDSGYKVGLVIVGDGPFRDNLQEILKDYPVLFTGFQTGETLATLYASSDVFVFPSTTDTFGNVVLEAQASGLPVIVSDRGGPKELIIDNETGIMVKSNDGYELTNAMISFIKDRNKRTFLGYKARRYMVQKEINDGEAYSTILYNNNSSSGNSKTASEEQHVPQEAAV